MNTAIKLILIASIASMVFLAGCVSQSTTSSANTTQQSTQPINSQNTQYYHQNGIRGGGNGGNGGIVNSNGDVNVSLLCSDVDALPKQTISSEEKEGLLEMREEEKLARDVYLTLYAKWNLPIFKNIANSEQTHTDSIKHLLEKYNISDPVKNDSIGNFSNQKYVELYNSLVEKGSKSEIDALMVGATIEDLDIYDLENWINNTDNEDITLVYENLMKGSRNHMRSFVRMLNSYGVNYTPQYISSEEYEQIINSSMERGQ